MTALLLDSSGLESLLGEAVDEAASTRQKRVISVSQQIDCPDPVAVVFASRRASEPWFCWQQPDRDFALAALGTDHSVISHGKDRFREVAAEFEPLSGEAVLRGHGGSTDRSGPTWTGGFSFSEAGPAAGSAWSPFAAASMTLPEVLIEADHDRTLMTVNAFVQPGADEA